MILPLRNLGFLIPSWNALYIDIYILYIAVNISRITVDKYSGLLTIRGTSASFSTLLPLSFGCHRPQGPTRVEEEEETLILFLFHLIKIQTSRSKLHQLLVTLHPQSPFLNPPLSDPGPEGWGSAGLQPLWQPMRRCLVGQQS